jgi:hypothetical protein
MILNPNDRNDQRLESAIAGGQRIAIPEPPDSSEFLAGTAVALCGTKCGVPPSQTWFTAFRQRRGARIATVASIFAMIAVVWFYSGVFVSTAIAQVIDAVTQHQLVKYKLHQVGEFKVEFKQMYRGNANSHYIVYADLQKSRMRLENPTAKTMNDVAEQSWEEILDYDADRYLQIYRFNLVLLEKDTTDERQLHFIRSILNQDPNEKKSVGPHTHKAKLFRVPRPDPENKGPLRKPYSDMGKDKSFLETLRILQVNDDTVAAKESLDGRNTTRYRLAEGDWTSTVWIDLKSNLPVRIEYELSGDAAGKQFASMKWIYTGFEWDPNVDNIDSLFSTEPPSGYEFEDHTNDE